MTTMAAAYVRKSTEQTGTSLEARSVARQIARSREFALGHGWSIPDAHVFADDGISGAEFEHRPGLQALLASLKPKPPFTHLVMMDSSRLGRESFETNYVMKRLLQAGVRVHTYLDGREITAQDKMRHTVNGLVDDEERERGRRRTRDAMQTKARQGHVAGGSVFGYRNVEVRDAQGRRAHVTREIVPAEAAVLRQLAALYVDGLGFRGVAKRLNADHALAPTPRRPGRPRGWSPSSVRDCLMRSDYRGVLTWGRKKKRDEWGATHPTTQPTADWITVAAPQLRILDAPTAAAIDARLTDQRAIYLRASHGTLASKPVNGMDSKFLLTGLAVCGTCGGAFAPRLAAGRSRHQVYRCRVNHSRGASVCANTWAVPVAVAETAVLNLIESVVLNPRVVQAAIAAVVQAASPAALTHERARLRTQLRACDDALTHLTDAIALGGDGPTLVRAVQTREQERVTLTQALGALDTRLALDGLDTGALRPVLEAKLAGWRDLLTRHPQQARAILSKCLDGRLIFTPTTDPVSGARAYVFTGAGRLDAVVAGVVPMPPTTSRPVMSRVGDPGGIRRALGASRVAAPHTSPAR